MADESPEVQGSLSRTPPPAPSRGFRYLVDLVRSNWISCAGSFFATFGFLATVVFFTAHALGLIQGPYLGLVTFFVLPAVFFLGLLLVPIGLVVYRQGTQERLQSLARHPLRVLRFLAVLTALNVLLAVFTAGRAVDHLGSTAFCGEACHSVMQPQYEAFLDSPHRRIRCVDCHVGPGAGSFVRSKLDGVTQAWHMLRGTVELPIPAHGGRSRPAEETCGTCHDPRRDLGDSWVVRQRTDSSPENEARVTAMLVHVGGEALDGTLHGAHAHSHPGQELEFIATDETLREIPWVRVRRTDGTTSVYTAYGTDPDAPPPGVRKKMDCHDCHNRTGHDFPTLAQALDEAFAAGRLQRSVPSLRARAEEILSAVGFAEDPDAQIRDAVEAEYAGSAAVQSDGLEATVVALQELHRSAVYPHQRVDGQTYPHWIGHDGCMRCHDGMHENEAGDAIPFDCASCHDVVADDVPANSFQWLGRPDRSD